VVPADGYPTSRRVLESVPFAALGLQVRKVPVAYMARSPDVEGARLVLLETPANPRVDVCDIRAATEQAQRCGALVAVDNTVATALAQQPLELGADLSVASDTKALTGHGDLVLGHVAARDTTLVERLRAWRSLHGAIPGPVEVWLAHRSLATLALRLDQQQRNAIAIAELIEKRPEVRAVRYPGLASHPAHEVARAQMRFFGPLVAFSLPSRSWAEGFLAASELVTHTASFGSVHTSGERRARWGEDHVPHGFVRLSVGCEDARDLTRDITVALDAAARSR
jgi:cystathionine gamma-lyase